MEESLTAEQKAEILTHQIMQATKEKIVLSLQPQLEKLATGHHHFDKNLSDAIINHIKNI
jgi:hypothetical protein